MAEKSKYITFHFGKMRCFTLLFTHLLFKIDLCSFKVRLKEIISILGDNQDLNLTPNPSFSFVAWGQSNHYSQSNVSGHLT